MNEAAKLDPQARARRKTAVLWFVAVTFGTMALLSLPISRLIQSGLGKVGLLHHALGPVERLIRPNSGWKPPASALPPSAQAEVAGPVLQPGLFPSMELTTSTIEPAPVQPPPHFHSITMSALSRPSQTGPASRLASHGRNRRPRREHEHHQHRPRRQ